MSTTDAATLVIAPRFAGPPGSGNGGYVAGRLASFVDTDGPVQVTLRQPPPLEVELDVRTGANGVTALSFGGALIAEAMAAELEGHVVDPVDYPAAVAAMDRYAGAVDHPFPGCFVCGIDRPVPDGAFGDVDGELPAYLVWAALDCPGGWSSDLAGRPMVLGRMTAAVDARPVAGDRCVVVGQRLREDGRKTFTASTAYDSDGRVLGRAEATWIALRTDPA